MNPQKLDQAQVNIRSAKLNEYISRKQAKSVTTKTETKRGEQILSMTVQISENKCAVIQVYENDDFIDLAQKFCTDHQLNEQMIEVIADSIRQNVFKVEHDENQIPSDSGYQSCRESPSQHLKRVNVQSGVHQRLFQDAEKKQSRHQLRVKQFEMDTDVIKIQPKLTLNAGEVAPWDQMYNRGQQKHQEKKLHAEQFQREQQDKLMQECTYQPKINDISRQLVKTRTLNLPQDLINQGLVTKQKKQNQKTFLQNQEELCTFHPEINPISAIIVDEMRQNETKDSLRQEDLFLNLHLQHKAKEEQQRIRTAQYFSENCPFKPQIDELSQRIVEGTTFQQRQQQFLSKQGAFQLNAMEQQKFSESCYFQPSTGHQQKKVDTESQADLFNNLHDRGKLQDQIRQIQLDIITGQQDLRSQTQAISSSSKMVDLSRVQALKQLFDTLDSDGDGKITYHRMNRDAVDPARVQIIQPILEDLKITKREISREEFIESCMNLLKKLTIQDKHQLISGESKKKELNTNYTFHVQCLI